MIKDEPLYEVCRMPGSSCPDCGATGRLLDSPVFYDVMPSFVICDRCDLIVQFSFSGDSQYRVPEGTPLARTAESEQAP